MAADDPSGTRTPPFSGLKHALDRPDDKIWIHDQIEVVRTARKLVPERVHLGLIPGRPWDELGLPSPRICILLPTNTPPARERMVELAGALHAAGHTVRIIDPTDRDENWTLAQNNLTHDDLMGWAAERMRKYPDPPIVAPEPELPLPATPSTPRDSSPLPAVVAADAQQPALGATPEIAQDAPDRAESASVPPAQESPDKPPIAKRRLAVVDGNVVRAPKEKSDPDPDQLPAFSEYALAKRFADGPGQDWRYTSAWNLWARWIGHRWEPDEKKGVLWSAKQCCTAALQEHLEATPTQRMKLTTLKTTNAVIALAGSDPRLAAVAQDWDRDPMLLGTPDGVIDLTTGRSLPGVREQMISKSTSCSPASGKHPWWDRVLERGHKDDAEVAGLIHRWCGYLLTGDTREERFLFIHGPGAGGKSKFVMVLSEILADYRKTAKMESFTAKDKTEHSEEIARLAGARMVTATETEEGSRWNEARIKTLTGRDVIAARHMHKSTFEFQPQFKLVFVGNHRPALRTVGEEMRRRIDLIEWGGTIPEAERVLDLSDRLRKEYPAILAWMIEGCLAWQREGLGKPTTVETATREYLASEDTFGAWLDECAVINKGDRVKTSAAYHNYKRWAEQAGEYVGSQKRFTQRMKDRGFLTVKAGTMFFQDLRLKPGQDDDYGPAGWQPPD